MGENQESGLEVRVIREMERDFKPSHKLVLTDPSQLEYVWFEITGDEERIAPAQDELWEKYNPQFKKTIDSFDQFIEGGAFLEEISDIPSLEYAKARTLKKTTIREYDLPKEIAEAKGKRTSGKWHSLPIELVAYMLSYQMPMIEEWKTSYDVSRDNNVSESTINNLCADPDVEAIKRKKWYISPLGEQVIPTKLSKKDGQSYSHQKQILQLQAQIRQLQRRIALYEQEERKIKTDQAEKLKAESEQTMPEGADTDKYQKQIETLASQLAQANKTIKDQQHTLQEQDKTIAEMRARYGAGSEEYFSRLAEQSAIVDQALSRNRPPELSQVIELLAYLHRASKFQPQVLPAGSDYSPAMTAQSITSVAPKAVLEWYGNWIENQEQRFATNLAKYFTVFTSELQERCAK